MDRTRREGRAREGGMQGCVRVVWGSGTRHRSAGRGAADAGGARRPERPERDTGRDVPRTPMRRHDCVLSSGRFVRRSVP